MGDKTMKGEGDYEAARKFDKDEERFVKEHTKDGKTIKGDASKATGTLTAAEREGRSHAKGLEQEKRDAKFMDKRGNKGKK